MCGCKEVQFVGETLLLLVLFLPSLLPYTCQSIALVLGPLLLSLMLLLLYMTLVTYIARPFGIDVFLSGVTVGTAAAEGVGSSNRLLATVTCSKKGDRIMDTYKYSRIVYLVMKVALVEPVSFTFLSSCNLVFQMITEVQGLCLEIENELQGHLAS